MGLIVTTTDDIHGATIVATVGFVFACVPFIGTKYAEGISDLNGKAHRDIEAVLERRRGQALARMENRARFMGANAVVGVRFDHREINSTWKEIVAYGTAVVINAVRQPVDGL
jgi:uncharacterized protein YbjQ (UPF0145 family)